MFGFCDFFFSVKRKIAQKEKLRKGLLIDSDPFFYFLSFSFSAAFSLHGREEAAKE